MADIIQLRRDTAANWTSANPTLAQGELGVETDTDKIKVGDGSTAWTSLGYLINTGGYASYADTTANFTGTLQNGGSNVIVDSDIGSTVQAYDATIVVDADIGVTVQGYDANTAKYNDVTANFTGTLQNGGSNVVVDSDIGSTVQAYDATILNDADIGVTVQAYDSTILVDADIGSTVQSTVIHKGTNYTAASGDNIVVTAGSITITLPASPSAGDYVQIKDGTGAAETTSFTVARNGSNIASSATDLTFDKNFADITMTYVDATIGWTV